MCDGNSPLEIESRLELENLCTTKNSSGFLLSLVLQGIWRRALISSSLNAAILVVLFDNLMLIVRLVAIFRLKLV